MNPLDTEDRLGDLKDKHGIGLCNITKCCTKVCPEHITITDNAIIPLKERRKFVYLAGNPSGGHWRKDLTDHPVRFFAVYSYLIVYRPETKPLEIVALLHGYRDLKQLLNDRMPRH